MSWQVQLSRQAERTFQRLPASARHRMERAIDSIATNPRPQGKSVKAIEGTKDAFLRYRVGDHRILYEIIDVDRTVLILAIVHRSDLEEWLKRQR